MGRFQRGMQFLGALLGIVMLASLANAQSLTLPGQIPSAGQDSSRSDPSMSMDGQEGGRGQEEAAANQGSASQGGAADGAAPRADWENPNYGNIPGASGKGFSGAFPPFGIDLFKGGFQGTKADGLTPGYRVKPGDEVVLRVWGAAQIDRVVPVDAQGNIFIPAIGPVKVQGLNAQQLDQAVRQAIRSVYPNNVEVYTNLKGVQPVGVFVTGYVKSPGRYAGTPSDSLLYFLDQADGIDPNLGSYRRIRILRDGETIARVDLYQFLLKGTLPDVQFRDGDTILVEERGAAIFVGGDVERQYRYELLGEELTGEQIRNFARLKSGVSHAFLTGSRKSGPMSRYLPLDRFDQQTLRNGDAVYFTADRRADSIVVKLEGSYYGPSRYVLPRDAHLSELLDAVAVPKTMTAIRNISIKRESVAKRQKEALEQSLRRLETTYLGASSATNEEAQIRVKEAEMIQSFVERARQVEPSGRLVVAHKGRINDIRLQDGDVVTIPERSDSVLVSGEVVVPQAVVYKEGRTVSDYIQGAGGFSRRAAEDHILVVRQNGAVEDASQVALRSGDEILVMPEVPTKNLQLASSITEILYQIAVATKVAIDL